MIYQAHMTPDAILEVEESFNVVLVTPERRITITNIQAWIDQLAIARTVRGDRWQDSLRGLPRADKED